MNNIKQEIKSEPITRRESFAMMFGVLDVLVYIKPHLAQQAQETLMDLFRLYFPDKEPEDYLDLTDKLHAEKTGSCKDKIEGIFKVFEYSKP